MPRYTELDSCHFARVRVLPKSNRRAIGLWSASWYCRLVRRGSCSGCTVNVFSVLPGRLAFCVLGQLLCVMAKRKRRFDARPTTIVEVLQGLPVFRVPRFQRGYAWSTIEVDELLNDLFGDVDLCREYDVDKGELPPPHFVGSVVTASEEESGSALELLDGQQRLATLMALLSVLANHPELHDSEQRQRVNDLLDGVQLGARKGRPKLELQDPDSQVFRWLLGGRRWKLTRAEGRSPLARAIERITADTSDRVQQMLRRCSGHVTARSVVENMIMRVAYTVEFVHISAESLDDAYAVFETLNDRGLALNAADLVKNKILSRAGGSTEMADEWDMIVSTVGRSNIVDFLRHYWISRFDLVRKKDLYRVYQMHIAELSREKLQSFLTELSCAAKHYRVIATPSTPKDELPPDWDATLVETLVHLNDLKIRSCRPLLLAVSSRLDDLKTVASFSEAVAVRYVVVGGGSTSRLEGAFQQARDLIRTGTNAAEALEEAFRDLMPDDDAFRASLARVRVDSQESGWRRILIELERELSNDELEVSGTSAVHIEHVLPQEPREGDLESWGIVSREDSMDVVGSLGNITLLSGKLNQKGSNRSFSEKKTLYRESRLGLNKYFIDLERWGPDEIAVRTISLSDLALRVWPDRPGTPRNA